MAVVSKSKQALIAAEAAADKGTAPTGKHHDLMPVLPTAVTPPAPDGPAYKLTDFVYKEADGIISWTAQLMLGTHPAAVVAWSGAKRVAVLSPLAKTSGAATELTRFESAAGRHLPGKNSVQDLIQVLIFTSEPAITAFNRVALLKGVAGSYDIAMRPELIIA